MLKSLFHRLDSRGIRADRRQAIGRACCEPLELRRLLSFTAASFPVGPNPQAVATADLNEDGRLDLVTSNPSDFNISVLLGDGLGGFGAAAHFDASPNAAANRADPWFADHTERDASLVIADFNEDGKLDVATVHRYRDPDTYDNYGYLSLLLGNGDGTFQTATALDSAVEAAAAGDFNGDGHLDLLVGADFWNDSLGQLRVLRGNGRGGFTKGPDEWLDYPPDAVGAGDFNGDGKLDAIVLSGNIWTLLGNGDGTFGHRDEWGIDPGGLDLALLEGFGWVVVGDTISIPSDHVPNGSMHTGVASGDFNGDGKPDVVTSDGDTGTVSLLLGNGDGTVRYIGAFATGSSPTAIAVGDFNGDGRPDVAAANGASNNVSVLINDGIWPGNKTFVGPGGNGSGGNWSNANNWSPPGVPAASDHVSIAAGKSVNLGGSATVASLALSGGATLSIGANGNRVLRTSNLTIGDTSKLNLNDNDLIIDYSGVSPIGGWNGSAYTGVTGLIQTGRTPGGTWDGAGGIGTSMPQAVEGLTTLAVAEPADVLSLSGSATALWGGQTIDATTVIVKYTYTGDVDLNGYVDAADYGVIDNFIQFPGTSGYFNGDFNYDGVIDAADYGCIDNSIQLQGLPL